MDTVEELYNTLPKNLTAYEGNRYLYTAWLNIERLGSADSDKIRVTYIEWETTRTLSDQRILLESRGDTLTETLLDMLCKVKVYRDEHKDI